MSIPVIVQVLLVFGLVVAATALHMHLGLAAVAGGVVFALWRGVSLPEIGRAALTEFLDPDTLLLLVLVTMIMALSAAMKKSGALGLFAGAVRAVAPSARASIALTPLLFGTLPMPGGAALSAPLVDAIDPDRRLGADRLAAANYWFRHALELAWPLYPAFILTSTLSGIATPRLILLNLYAMPVLVALGQVFVLGRGVDRLVGTREKSPAEDTRITEQGSGRFMQAVAGFAPLAIILGTYLSLDVLWRLVSPGMNLDPRTAALAGRFGPIMLGIVAGAVYVAIKDAGRGAFKGTVSVASLKLAAIIAGIRVFAALLETGDVAAASAAELAAAGISPILVAVLLPFISGLVTGVGFGYVGIAFPIVMGLFPAAGGALPREAAVVLAGAFGYAGMMLSPLHVCLVVTAGHFGTGLLATIRRYAPPLLAFLVVAIGYVAVLSAVL